jgi:general secretion pathway protein E
MPSADQHGLPRALAERLGDDARAAFAEAPREARFRLLAQALNLDEAALLAELARLTGLEVLEEPAIDAEGLKVLPARIAAEAQVVPTILAGAPEGSRRTPPRWTGSRPSPRAARSGSSPRPSASPN